jgi:hypothetical protein
VSVNLFGEEWEGGRDRPGWQWKHLHVSGKLGAEKIGAGLYELAPGQKTFPYHRHQVQEEWPDRSWREADTARPVRRAAALGR